jgi:DNA-binding GntR family transcriptional regulator
MMCVMNVDPRRDQLRIHRVTTVDEVVRALRAEMLDGRLAPGSPLREQALAAQVTVSRGTIREAMRVLTAEGLIEHAPHRGAVVTRVSPDGLRQIFALREMCEVTAVDAMFAHRPKRRASVYQVALAAMAAATRAMRSAERARDVSALFEHDLEFHRQLVGTLDNSRISTFYGGAQTELRLVANLADRGGYAKGFQRSHRRVLDALMGSSQAAAKAEIKGHLRSGHALLEAARQAAEDAPD